MGSVLLGAHAGRMEKQNERTEIHGRNLTECRLRARTKINGLTTKIDIGRRLKKTLALSG